MPDAMIYATAAHQHVLLTGGDPVHGPPHVLRELVEARKAEMATRASTPGHEPPRDRPTLLRRLWQRITGRR